MTRAQQGAAGTSRSFQSSDEAAAHRAAELERLGLPAAVRSVDAAARAMGRRKKLRTAALVYFAQAESGGPIKIGCAGDVAQRLSELQTGNPEPLVLLAVTDGGEVEERRLHRLVARHRQRGEWYRPAPDLVIHVAELRQAKVHLLRHATGQRRLLPE